MQGVKQQIQFMYVYMYIYLKGHQQVFAGKPVIGAIFYNTEMRVLGKSNFIALHCHI